MDIGDGGAFLQNVQEFSSNNIQSAALECAADCTMIKAMMNLQKVPFDEVIGITETAQ